MSSFFEFSAGGSTKARITKSGTVTGRQLAALYGTNFEKVGFFTNGNNFSAGFGSDDRGNDEPGFSLVVGSNSNSTNPNPGTLSLTASSGVIYYLWVSNSGNVHIGTGPPAGAVSDTSGTIVGSQTSSGDAKNIAGRFTNYRGALDTILQTNLYNFSYKKSDYPNARFVGLLTDEAPTFGQYPDAAHPNGRSLNVVNSIGYLMAAIKAQQEDIQALKLELAQLKR